MGLKRLDIRGRVRHAMKLWHHRTGWRVSATRVTRHYLNGVTLLASVVCVALVVAYIGYEHEPKELVVIRRLLRAVQWVFTANILINTALSWRRTVAETRIVKWIVDVGVMVLLIPTLLPAPLLDWMGVVGDILYDRRVQTVVLLAYALTDLCWGVMQALGKRTNPSLILSVSFLIFIAIGSFLLMMPRCTLHPISYIDSLFVATSAVCITGLTPVDVSATFTPLGLLVLGMLIQVGGLGVMTVTSFFALFFTGNTSIYNQLMIKDMIESRTINALVPTLLYILGFTLVIEVAGAAAVWLSIHGTLGMDTRGEVVFALFHSVSAFCNAGFSNLPGGLSNPRLMNSDQSIYIVISLIVIAGSIGFPILVNFRDIVVDWLKRVRMRLAGIKPEMRNVHIYSLNTKVTLYTTTVIFVVSVLAFWLMERHNTLEGLSRWVQWVQAVFNSTTPRSSGFTSVNPASFLDVTLVMVMFQMWVGGAAQSTAGGIKVNTFAALLLNLRAIVTGRERATVFNRRITVGSIRRANAVVTLSIVGFLLFTVTLLLLEPTLPARSVIFECVSGLFTVGSSLGITPELHAPAKGVLCAAMFLGRVGIISLLVGIMGERSNPPVRFPEENLIIN